MTTESYVEKPKTLAELREGIASGRMKATDLAVGYYERIEQVNPRLNVYLSLTKERALAQAAKVDGAAAKGDPLGPLAGIPRRHQGRSGNARRRRDSRLKDPQRLSSALRRYGCSRKLESAGAVLLGKLNCDEFAMGSSNENSAYGPVRNPVDTDRVPGGSSGGSAAAVAANIAVATLGSDTGGSIRQPASFCGVVGVLPTYGRVSRYGLIAFASSLDRVGPFANNVRDAATLLSVIAGHDANDATSSPAAVVDYATESDKGAEGLRIGVPAEYFGEGLDPEVRERIESGIDVLKAAGCVIKPISLPHTRYAIPTYYLVATAEASANLARFDGVRYGYRSASSATLSDMYSHSRDEAFGAEVKRRIMLGTYALSAGYYDAYYLKAQKVRRLLAEEFIRAFAEVDAIVTPTAPTPAFKLGEKTGDPLAMYLADIYTVTASLAGIWRRYRSLWRNESRTSRWHAGSGAAHFNEAIAFRVARHRGRQHRVRKQGSSCKWVSRSRY